MIMIMFKACPGQLLNYPKSYACRISTLGDGTIVEQTVTPVELCDFRDIQMFKLRIAKKYRVGDGKVTSQSNSEFLSCIVCIF